MEKRGRGRPRKVVVPVVEKITIKKMYHCNTCNGYFYKWYGYDKDAILVEPLTNCMFCGGTKFEEIKEKA